MKTETLPNPERSRFIIAMLPDRTCGIYRRYEKTPLLVCVNRTEAKRELKKLEASGRQKASECKDETETLRDFHNAYDKEI